MSKVKVIDKSKQFTGKAELAADQAIQHMAIDIETLVKVKNVPQKSGRLQGTIVHFKVGKHHWRVPANTVYARFQEFGGDSKRRVKNYSKPGSGPHYLRNSGDTIKKNAITYFKSRLGNIKV